MMNSKICLDSKSMKLKPHHSVELTPWERKYLDHILSHLKVGDIVHQTGKDWEYGVSMTITELCEFGFEFKSPYTSGYVPYHYFINGWIERKPLFKTNIKLDKRIPSMPSLLDKIIEWFF